VIEVHARDGGDVPRAAEALTRLGGGTEPAVDRATRRVSVPVDAGADRLVDVVRALDDLDVAVEDIALRRPTLDEVFVALTGAPAGTESEVAA
jgi:ABC-2 type transport system ATP-binding protein